RLLTGPRSAGGIMASGLCARLTGRTHGCTDQPANVKKTLANSEPSTHGTKRHFVATHQFGRFRSEADIEPRSCRQRSLGIGTSLSRSFHSPLWLNRSAGQTPNCHAQVVPA